MTIRKGKRKFRNLETSLHDQLAVIVLTFQKPLEALTRKDVISPLLKDPFNLLTNLLSTFILILAKQIIVQSNRGFVCIMRGKDLTEEVLYVPTVQDFDSVCVQTGTNVTHEYRITVRMTIEELLFRTVQLSLHVSTEPTSVIAFRSNVSSSLGGSVIEA